MNTPSTTLLTQCIESFGKVRKNLLEAAELLFRVKESEAWKGEYEDFGSFIEDGCNFNRTQGTRLAAAFEHYVAKGGIPVSQLNGVNPERLYLAIGTGGDLNMELARAKTLTVAQLRQERKEKDGHECVPIQVCSICHARIYDQEAR